MDLCERIGTFSSAYVLIVTATRGELDNVLGVAVRADDHVTKPFSPFELVARVRAMLGRPRHQETGEKRSSGTLGTDPLAREVKVGDKEVTLTTIEFDVLDTLSSGPGRASSHRQVIERVWR